MAMNKIERIDKEIAKTREKITEYQNRLRGLEAQKTEAENLQIVQLVRSMRLSPHSGKLMRGKAHGAHKLYDLQVFRFGFLRFKPP